MSCSPFNEFISSPHFNEPFEFITPDRIGDLVQPDFCPTFNPFQVEQSNLDTSIIEVIHPNLQTVGSLDADALLERLDQESEQEDVEEVVEVDPIEVLETSSCNDSVVELVEEDVEDYGHLLSPSDASHLDLRKKRRNTLSMECLRRPSFKVVPAKVKYEGLGEKVHIPLPTPERRADFSEPLEPVVEPEATFVWKGEEGGLKLDKVKNYEEFGLPLTNMKLHKKWRSNRARRIYFKEPTLDLCRMRNNNQESGSEELEEESKLFLPGFKVPIIHHSEFEEPVLLHLESGEPILVQKVGGGRRPEKIDFDAQYLRLCNLLPLNQDHEQVPMEMILEATCIFVRHLAQQEIQLARLKVREINKQRALKNHLSFLASSF